MTRVIPPHCRRPLRPPGEMARPADRVAISTVQHPDAAVPRSARRVPPIRWADCAPPRSSWTRRALAERRHTRSAAAEFRSRPAPHRKLLRRRAARRVVDRSNSGPTVQNYIIQARTEPSPWLRERQYPAKRRRKLRGYRAALKASAQRSIAERLTGGLMPPIARGALAAVCVASVARPVSRQTLTGGGTHTHPSQATVLACPTSFRRQPASTTSLTRQSATRDGHAIADQAVTCRPNAPSDGPRSRRRWHGHPPGIGSARSRQNRRQPDDAFPITSRTLRRPVCRDQNLTDIAIL